MPRVFRSTSLSVVVLLVITATSFAQTTGKELVHQSGVAGGLVVHVGCGNGQRTAAMRVSDSYQVQGLDVDPPNVAAARQHIVSKGLNGPVSAIQFDGRQLPYIDNLVNLIVVEEQGELSTDEILRVLCPDGVAMIQVNGQWQRTVKPRPDEIDDWTHYLHSPGNNAVAKDDVVDLPRRMQWVGNPRYSRHHDHMSALSAMVSANGRIFYIIDEASRFSIELPPRWKLIARDAFNGAILWKRDIPEWHTHLWPLKNGPAQLPRRLVAVGETVYVTLSLNAPVTAIDAKTGKTIRTYQGASATEEIILSEGVLFLATADRASSAIEELPTISDIKRRGGQWSWQDEKRKRAVMAVEAETGKILWKQHVAATPLTLAADGHRVYLHDGEKVVGLHRETGEQQWASEPLPIWATIKSYFGPTLVVYEGVVLFAGGEKMVPHRGGADSMTAMDAATGKTLWKAPHPPGGYQSPEDILVSGGLVWTGATTSGGYDGVFSGRDPKTGEVKAEFPPDVSTYWFHHRCYRGKATEKYLLMSRTGIEFLDTAKKSWTINHWVRGACLYGIMPCNGLIYAPPHPCACYPEAKLYGIAALAPESSSLAQLRIESSDNRLTKGPAFGATTNGKTSEAMSEWPTYRGDAARRGATTTAVSTDLKPAWKSKLRGRLSSVVVADGKLLVSMIDAHTIVALDAESGEAVWRYVAGGRVDSPPTIYRGLALFGCADGHVYCVRVADGELAWKFRAAPVDLRHAAFEQIESVWPVHGNILIEDDLAWFVAGRSIFLDGGLTLYRLNPITGEVVSAKTMDSSDPQVDGGEIQDRIQILNMPVGLPDIMSSDGRFVYMRSQVFDKEGVRQDLGPHSGNPAEQGAVQQGETAHLFAPYGFTDDSWFHRSYWVYGRSFAGGHGGYFQAGKFTPSGRILVTDDENVYGYARKPQYYRWTTTIEHQLYSASKKQPEATPASRRRPTGSPMVQMPITPSLNPSGKALAIEAWVKADKPNGVVVARGGPADGFALVILKGQPRFVVRSSEVATAVTAKQRVVGKWVHLTGVLTADAELQLFVDGKLAAAAKAPKRISTDPKQAMEIGADAMSAVGDYKSPMTLTGTVDSVRLFFGTVTADDVSILSEGGDASAIKTAKLAFATDFKDGKAQDTSGNKNHGTVVSAKAIPGRTGEAKDALQFVAGPSSSNRKSGGFVVQHDWTADVPVLVRAMTLAGDAIFIAGPPDLIDEEEASSKFADAAIQEKLAQQAAAIDGELGGLLMAVSKKDGTTLASYELESPPTFDGMAAANGRLYFTTMDGHVVCYEER